MDSFRIAKNNRSKSVWTLFQRKLLNNQTVWPVIFGLTGPICARALKSFHLFELRPRGHHDWPVKPTIRTVTESGGFSDLFVLRSSEFLGESDEKPFRPADVAEPIRVFILDYFAYELRAALAELFKRLVDVVHGEHDAEVA